jgi:hypothetical protein
LKVEPDVTAQVKPEVGVLSATLKVKNQSENHNGNLDDYNVYGDSSGNRDQTSPLASPGNDTITGTGLRIESHDHDNVVSTSYSPSVKVGRGKDTTKNIPTVTSKRNETTPTVDSSRIESETSDQTKPAVNAPSEKLTVKSQPEMDGRRQLPHMETGEKSNTGSINSVVASEGDGQCQLIHSVDLSLEERSQPDKERAHSPAMVMGRERSDSPASGWAPMTELKGVNLADDDPKFELQVNNQPCPEVLLYTDLGGIRMSSACSNHPNVTVLVVELDLKASLSTLRAIKPAFNPLRVEPEFTEGAQSPISEVKGKRSNRSTSLIMGLNEVNLVDNGSSMSLQVNSQMCFGASHPGWEVGKISDTYSTQAKPTILDMKKRLSKL